jgi:hypothetical protein
MGEMLPTEPPWGRCPCCGRALVRDELMLEEWPMRVFMQGPPVCESCSPEEVERYLGEWEGPSEWG